MLNRAKPIHGKITDILEISTEFPVILHLKYNFFFQNKSYVEIKKVIY